MTLPFKRKDFLRPYFYKSPNIIKFKELLSTENIPSIKLSSFVGIIMKKFSSANVSFYIFTLLVFMYVFAVYLLPFHHCICLCKSKYVCSLHAIGLSVCIMYSYATCVWPEFIFNKVMFSSVLFNMEHST